MTVTVRRRVARKTHRARCCSPAPVIRPGDVYLEHKEFPGGDTGYADTAGHPVVLRECANCARRYGRAHLLDPPTPEPDPKRETQ